MAFVADYISQLDSCSYCFSSFNDFSSMHSTWLLALPLLPSVLGAERCGVPGIELKLPYFVTTSKTSLSPEACGIRCRDDNKCKSYAVRPGACVLYSSAIGTVFKASPRASLKYYDKICAPVKLSPPSVTTTTTASSGGSQVTSTTPSIDIGGVITSPAAQTSNSPPLSSSEVVFPSGTAAKDFIANYAFQDEPLPSIVANGSSPLAQGLLASADGRPDPPCAIDPSLTTNQFNMRGSNFQPLVSTSSRLQPLAAPTSEAQAKAMGPVDQLQLPAFFFQAPIAAPAGVYDIVLAGNAPKFLAKTSTGDLVLVDSSTGTKSARRGTQTVTTTIFGVNCKGRISVIEAGKSYTLDISGSTMTFTLGSGDKTAVAFPLQLKKPTKKARRSIWTDGGAPRCPKVPDGLVGIAKPGARAPASNGCGPANGFDFVPDVYNFAPCCDAHDLCFDDCTSGTFEGCNNDFASCLSGPGCSYLDHWYSYLDYGACLAAAKLYAFAVTTKSGRDAFYSANQERCGCYCSGSSGLCGRGNIETGGSPSPENYQCTSMFASDTANCGACGRTCSPKSIW